jgi:flavin-dependent dehydrogenase
MESFYDAAIIGGGPGGSTVATALARAGRRVVIFEREKFPRFHIGESLLPYNLPVFERLGLSEKIASAGYQKKYGAFFWNEETGGTRPVDFSTGVDDRHAMAYHVKRAEFDQLLLAHAAESGAEVHEQTAVERVLFEGRRAVGLRVSQKGGHAGEVRAKAVVDASGQDAMLAFQLNARKFDRNLRRGALFAHFTGVPRGQGKSAGDILLPVENGVWYWFIPFSDGTTSVGGVFEPKLLQEAAASDLEGRLDWLLRRSARARELLANAKRVSPVRGLSDYSAKSSRLTGDGFVLVGDAATFLDPVFSTGVFLAMATGERAARAIDAALTRHDRVDRRDLGAYEREAKRLFDRFRRFVYGFYDPVFFEAFCSEAPFEKIRAAVTTTLAGGVERPPLSMRIWTKMMFLGVGLDRWTRPLRRKAGAAGVTEAEAHPTGPQGPP